jgi:hypothetical protein
MIRRVLPIVVLVIVIAASAGATRTEAASTDDVWALQIASDTFMNYDFEERISSKWGVDWAVALMFWNNATINRVKGILGNEYDQEGGPMNGLLAESYDYYQNPAWHWDSDSGRKTTAAPGCPGQPDDARHYRIYADQDDQLYNMYWGYWVFGTDHYDIEECPGGDPAWHGYSENAEGWITWRWSVNGYGATNDWAWFYNPEPFRVEGNHIWENDGYASALYVP